MEILKKEYHNSYFIKHINENDYPVWKEKGYFPCIIKEKPEEKEGYDLIGNFVFNDDTQEWIKYWEYKLNKEILYKEIISLKQQLSETDYKVIKNMEAQLVNEELPYDSVTLHAERQALRDKINELEELLKQ